MVFEKLSLSIHAADRLAIKGATGSGKTLLLRSLSLLDAVDEGEIFRNGAPVANIDVPSFRREVVYLHQMPALIEGTVEDNLQAVFEFQSNQALTYDRDEIYHWLNALGIDNRIMETDTANLSGGERQIVGLIRAIQLRPNVLLLDEPTASLDEQTTNSVEELIDSWMQEELGKRAVVWVSHSDDQLSRTCDRKIDVSQYSPREVS